MIFSLVKFLMKTIFNYLLQVLITGWPQLKAWSKFVDMSKLGGLGEKDFLPGAQLCINMLSIFGGKAANWKHGSLFLLVKNR